MINPNNQQFRNHSQYDFDSIRAFYRCAFALKIDVVEQKFALKWSTIRSDPIKYVHKAVPFMGFIKMVIHLWILQNKILDGAIKVLRVEILAAQSEKKTKAKQIVWQNLKKLVRRIKSLRVNVVNTRFFSRQG